MTIIITTWDVQITEFCIHVPSISAVLHLWLHPPRKTTQPIKIMINYVMLNYILLFCNFVLIPLYQSSDNGWHTLLNRCMYRTVLVKPGHTATLSSFEKLYRWTNVIVKVVLLPGKLDLSSPWNNARWLCSRASGRQCKRRERLAAMLMTRRSAYLYLQVGQGWQEMQGRERGKRKDGAKLGGRVTSHSAAAQREGEKLKHHWN